MTTSPPGPDRSSASQQDWTWVLRRRCEQCGLEAAAYNVSQVADQLEFAAAEWVQILTGSPAADDRSLPTAGSPLEHGAHVRDALVRFDERLAQMLEYDDPEFADRDPDRANQDDANQDDANQDDTGQDPDAVAEQLMSAAVDVVERLRAITPAHEDRTGRCADGTEFTVRSLAQYVLHDVTHHLWDITGQPAAPAPNR